jgi:cell division protein FtsQ
MKINKKVISISLWSLGSVALLVSLGFSDQAQMEQKCLGAKIRVADQTGHYFIEPRDVMDVLNSRGSRIKGSTMKDINTGVLEKIVYSNPFVGKAEVYSTIDGHVNIDVWQRNPVLRIVNRENEHFYVDDQGAFMPVSDKYSCPVIVASGNIFDDYAEKNLNYAVPNLRDTNALPILVQLNEIALYLKHNDFWDAQIEQIYVNELSEIELIPRVGNQKILIGNSSNLEEKMNNLFIFYKEGVSKAGWESYGTINLKFKDQVICTRKDKVSKKS